MNALIKIHTGQIWPSPFNSERSKRYSSDSLEKLANNLSEHGQIEPVIVRKKKDAAEGCYELVAGERRWRGCELAGIKELDCIVRDLTDRQVCDIMLSENLQRENLKAVEEACVFADMLKATDHEGRKIYESFDDLFIVTGKKRQVIKNRLCLLNCPEFLLVAIDANLAPARNGEMVGRVPNPARREEAAKRSLKSMYREGPMTVKECATMLSKEFMVSLDGCGVDLDDADILPVEFDDKKERCAGGACRDCPLRSENDPSVADLLMEAGSGSGSKSGVDPMICQNPPCLERKQAAVWGQIVKAAEAKGLRIMPKDKGKALLSGYDIDLGVYVVEGEMYIAQDEMPGREHTGHFANDDHPTWADLIDASKPAWIIVKDGRRPRYFLESEIAVQAAELILKRAGKASIFKKKKVGLGKALPDPAPVEDAGAPDVKDEKDEQGQESPSAGASVATSVTKVKPGDRAAMVEMMCKFHRAVLAAVGLQSEDMARVVFSHVLTRFTGEEGAKLLLEMVGCGDAETRDWQNWDIAAAHSCETFEDYQALTITAVLARFMAQWGLEWIGWPEWTGALGLGTERAEQQSGGAAEVREESVSFMPPARPSSGTMEFIKQITTDAVSGQESTVKGPKNEDYSCDKCTRVCTVPYLYVKQVDALDDGQFLCTCCGGDWVPWDDEKQPPYVKENLTKLAFAEAVEEQSRIASSVPQYTDADALPQTEKKRRGRPPGSKTKKAASKPAVKAAVPAKVVKAQAKKSAKKTRAGKQKKK